MKPQDYSDIVLTKGEIEDEANRLLWLYRKARKGKPGPEPHWRMFVTAGYLLLKKRKHHGIRLTIADASVIDSCFGFKPDPKEINRWIHGSAYRSTVEQEGKEFTRWIGGPFARAVAMVLAGLEGKPAPSQRQLLRCFRAPGRRNCSREELAAFQDMIDRMATDIATWRPSPDINELRKSDLFPRD